MKQKPGLPIIRLLTTDREHIRSMHLDIGTDAPLPLAYTWEGRSFRRVEDTSDYVEFSP